MLSSSLPDPINALAALSVVSGLIPAPAAIAQDLGAQRQEFARVASRTLVEFARFSRSNRQELTMASAYRLIIERYDPDHRAARRALGYRWKDLTWQVPAGDDVPVFEDGGNADQADRVEAAWRLVEEKLAAGHRELAHAALAAGDRERAAVDFEFVLRHAPDDKAAHEALGHIQYEGFFGTPEQVAFLQRLAAIETRARELAAQDYPVSALSPADLPEELVRVGRSMTGAESRHFVIWTRGDQARTDEMARWAERALAFLEFLLAGDPVFSGEPTRQATRTLWLGVIRGDDERDRFLRSNPHTLVDRTEEDARRFATHRFMLGGRLAEVAWHGADDDFDYVVAHVTQRCFAGLGNEGFGQGLVHAATWFMVGSTRTWYGELPRTESAEMRRPPAEARAWLAELRQQIRAGDDWPLEQVPRERAKRFRPQVRLKSWSFVTWLVARYPNRWARLTRAFPVDVVPMPEQVQQTIEHYFDRTLEDLESEWREWACGDSAIARVSGYGLR